MPAQLRIALLRESARNKRHKYLVDRVDPAAPSRPTPQTGTSQPCGLSHRRRVRVPQRRPDRPTPLSQRHLVAPPDVPGWGRSGRRWDNSPVGSSHPRWDNSLDLVESTLTVGFPVSPHPKSWPWDLHATWMLVCNFIFSCLPLAISLHCDTCEQACARRMGASSSTDEHHCVLNTSSPGASEAELQRACQGQKRWHGRCSPVEADVKGCVERRRCHGGISIAR